MPRSHRRIRPHIDALHPYVPGEQPKGLKLTKLNTNENPYPPSPRVLKAVKEAAGEQLRLYPHPTADPLRERLAELHEVRKEQIIVGNGSDELLALATRAFVAPAPSRGKAGVPNNIIQYFTPSYSLYPVLASIQDATKNEVTLPPSFALPGKAALQKSNWNPKAALTFITTPNAPSGRAYKTSDLKRLCKATSGVIILDEAYVDFADEDALSLVNEFDHVIVSRTFSKAYSLCFQRIGYFVGPEPLITALHKIRDSYNVNGLAQVAALATLGDLPYYRKNFTKVIRERDKLSNKLSDLGFKVLPSATNFILTSPPNRSPKAAHWYEELRKSGILVRWFSDPAVDRYLRISIGTPAENNTLMRSIKRILNTARPA